MTIRYVCQHCGTEKERHLMLDDYPLVCKACVEAPLPGWSEIVDYLLTLAPDPEPNPPDPPEDGGELDEDDLSHYDTPGGW